MARFEYVAKNTAGNQRSDVVSAETMDAAVDVLHAEGLIVLSIREVGEKVGGKLLDGASLLSRGVPKGAVALSTRQLATMLHAGLPLIRSLRALARDEKNQVLADVLVKVAEDIEGGDRLSRAMSKHPKVFSSFYVSLIRSGEESGDLDAIMRQLSVYLERTESIKRKVKSAMSYPVFVLSFVGIAGLVLFLKVVPMMGKVYEGLDQELPALTQIVIASSRLLTQYLWVVILLMVGVVVGFKMLKKNPAGKLAIDDKKLKIPIFGRIVKKLVLAKFMRTLGILVDSGIPVLSALELAAGSASNAIVEKAVTEIGETVSRGSKLSVGFGEAQVFPEIVVQMVSTGEETGTLGQMLSEVADFYDEQVETAINGLASLIEPLLMVVIGGIVGLVVIATFLPIFNMSSAIHG